LVFILPAWQRADGRRGSLACEGFGPLLQALAPWAGAQEGFKRTPLRTMEFPAGHETVMGLAEIGPGICEGRHTHPGIQSAFVLEGEGVSEIDGRPNRPVKAGDAIQIPANVPHNLCAAASGFKALAVYVIEKGKPLATPVP
jgi:quercetin dioxygenase-like cupin family protein